MGPLTIVLEQVERALLEAAWGVGSAWGGRVRVGVPRPSSGAQLILERGSLVRPAVIMRCGPELARAGEDALRLALAPVAWDGTDEIEPWRWLSAPLPRARFGAPRADAPWALVGAGLAGWSERSTHDALRGHQLHVIGRARSAAAVVWPARALGALLGRADVVVAEPESPLAWDAMRAGVPVRAPSVGLRELVWSDFPARLAFLAPPSLLREPTFLAHVATQCRSAAAGEPAEPLCTREWIALGRDAAAREAVRPSSALSVARRRAQKLLREPHRFAAESRLPWLRALAALRASDR